MNPTNKINNFFLLNKTKAQTPPTKQPDILFQVAQQSSSDETINTLSSSRSLPQTIRTTPQIPQSNHPAPSKAHGIVLKHPAFLRNGQNKDNCLAANIKGKEPEIRFQKTGNFGPPGPYRSHGELSLELEGLNPGLRGNNIQRNRDRQGRTEEIRINGGTVHPIEANNPMKEVWKGTGGQYRELAEGENFLKIIAEDRSKQEARGKFQIDFSDISETTSEIWRPNGTMTQPKKTGVASGGLNLQENTKAAKKEIVQTNKQEIEGIRVINNNQRRETGVIGAISNGFMEQLEKFPLKELTITKKGNFDKRYKLTQSYLDLCEKANQDPLKYYHENCKKEQQVIARNLKDDSQRNRLEEASDEEEDALEELEGFPLEELVITKKGLFDKRYKLTQQYLELCEKAGQDPLEYYHENME